VVEIRLGLLDALEAEPLERRLLGVADGRFDLALAVGVLAATRKRRTLSPATLRYALAVSRRTDVTSSIRLSDQPSRPSATTCCRFSSPKTLLIPAQEHDSRAFVNVSVATS
jgi:hypothetical protein